MFNNARLVNISVEGTRLQFNVEALTEISEYFQTMFNGKFVENEKNEIKLEEVHLKEFALFHEWVHEDSECFKALNVTELLELLIFADRFLVDRMKETIYKRINSLSTRQETPYEILETSILIGDLWLKDKFLDWLNDELAFPIVWTRDLIVEFLNRFFRYHDSLSNIDLSNEVLQEINMYLKNLHTQLMGLHATHLENNYSTPWRKEGHDTFPRFLHRIEIAKSYLQSLFEVKEKQQMATKDKISVKEHQMIHEWLFKVRLDFKDQTFIFQLQLMTMVKRFEMNELFTKLYASISIRTKKEKELSPMLFSVVEAYLQNGDDDIKNLFSLWVSRQCSEKTKMNSKQLLQSTSKLISWQYDIKVNKFNFSKQVLNEVDRVLQSNREYINFYYKRLMYRRDQHDLEEDILLLKQFEKELKFCTENQQEFKEFVTNKRQICEIELQHKVNQEYPLLPNCSVHEFVSITVNEDKFLDRSDEKLAFPIVWSRNLILDFIAGFFRYRESLNNKDVSYEAVQEINQNLNEMHKKLMELYATHVENNILLSCRSERIENMQWYLQSLFKVTEEQEIEKNDKISVEEHKLLHEWMFNFRHDFKDQTFDMQLRLMTITRRFGITELLGDISIHIGYIIRMEKVPYPMIYSLVEAYSLNRDDKLKSIFTSWVLRQFPISPKMKLNQLLQYTSKLLSWQYDIQVNKFALSEKASKEVDRILQSERNRIELHYEKLMCKSDRHDLKYVLRQFNTVARLFKRLIAFSMGLGQDEGILLLKKFEKELNDCAENQQEFKLFVTKKRQIYEKKLNNKVNRLSSMLTKFFKNPRCVFKRK